MLIQILGAAAQLVAFSFPDWETASFIGVPNLIYEITGSGGAARFVMVLFCFSVIANTAPTIYSCGLSAQVAIPWLVRGESGRRRRWIQSDLLTPDLPRRADEAVPRYFLAFVVSAVYLPVAIAGSTHFYTVLSNFSSVLGYWQAIFIPPMILEAVIFRAPVSTKTYPIDAWDQPSKLPIGISAIVAGCCVSRLNFSLQGSPRDRDGVPPLTVSRASRSLPHAWPRRGGSAG
jgi:purine-cytosine permease-like protein